MKSVLFRTLFCLTALIVYSKVHSYDIEQNGIYYNLFPMQEYVEVTSNELSHPSYSGNIVIPESINFVGKDYPVKAIGDEAFSNCTDLENIVLPESIDTIGISAFFYCTKLKSVALPSRLTTIKNSAFSNCYKLAEISLPESVQSIGTNVFFRDSALITPIFNSHLFAYLPPSNKGEYAIPDGINKISMGAFEDCKLINRIIIPESVVTIEDAAFRGCESLEHINLPSKVERIYPMSFMRCIKLNTISIPNNIKQIGRAAFSGCESLVNIYLHNDITEIDESSFFGCSSLKTIDLPSGLKAISNSLFKDCVGLTRVGLPEGLKVISAGAFSGCLNLSELNFPESIEFIEQDIEYDVDLPFYNCKSLKKALYNKNVFAFMPCDYQGDFTIPEGVTAIGSGAFYMCRKLTSINIPESIKYIGSSSFAGCNELKNLTIPYGPNCINRNTISYCSLLESLTIPESVVKIATNGLLLSSCSSNSTLNIFAKTPPVCEYDALSVSQEQTLCVPMGSKEIYESTTPWNKFANIIETEDFSEFSFNVGPFAWKAIGIDDEADYKAELEYSPYYEGTIDVPAFFSYENKTFKVVSIGDGAFYKLFGVTSLSLPYTLEKIGSQAFLNCNNIFTLEIPENVSFIGNRAFSGTNISSIKLPKNIEYLGEEMFHDCINLVEIKLPQSLVDIPSAFFWGCVKLSRIELSNNIETIGSYAFKDCNSLSVVRVKSQTPPLCENGVFLGTPYKTSCILEVPDGCLNIYSEANTWKDFYIINEIQGNTPENLQSIDLGLSVDWANINLGAEYPYECGNYYAWGETEPKDVYDINTSISYDVDFSNISGTKYDAAYCAWGNGWRIPTNEELEELLSRCSWQWTSLNGMNGYKIYGNDNYIFIPAAGIKQNRNIIGYGYEGAIWSSTPYYSNASAFAYHFYNGPDGSFSYKYGNRYLGFSIRPVIDKQNQGSTPNILIDDKINELIFNIFGQKVGQSKADFEKLPSGIYLMRGMKFIKK